MKLSLVFLAIFATEPIMGQYCPKECENQGIMCNLKCVFSNIQTEFAKNNQNNSTSGSNRDLNPSATVPISVPSDVKATFRSLGTQGREIASEIKVTAKSISNNPEGFASSLATRINDGLNNTPTQTNLNEAFSSIERGGNNVLTTLQSGFESGFAPTSTHSISERLNTTPTPTNLNEAFSSIERGGNNVLTTLQSGFENGFGPTSTYSDGLSSDFATTASIIGSEARNFASTLSSRLNNGTSTTSNGSRASPMNSIGSSSILGICIITLSSILLSSFI